MLSILIPTYNYNVVPLVSELYKQCLECDIIFEILVYDDGSKSQINAINNTINNIQNCTFKELPYNIGRSAIRNLLGKNAQYGSLIFLDADVIPSNKTFIKDYLDSINKPVIFGGLIPIKSIPEKPYKLRWVYTKKRERKTLCSSNFFIKKDIFENFTFDESIKKYGYEDVLFFSTLQNNTINIYSVNNPVIHFANDDADTFIKKTEDAIENLFYLMKQGKLRKEDSKIFNYYLHMKRLKLIKVSAIIFNVLKKPIVLNLNSNYPSLLLYDIYRIGYLCQLKANKNAILLSNHSIV